MRGEVKRHAHSIILSILRPKFDNGLDVIGASPTSAGEGALRPAVRPCARSWSPLLPTTTNNDKADEDSEMFPAVHDDVVTVYR